MKKIKLSESGLVSDFALVDDEDYDNLVTHRWCSCYQGTRKYALRHVRINGKRCGTSMHREIMHAQSGQEIDHINHDGLDNRKENLRFCTRSQNNQNRRKRYDCASKFKGVWFDRARNQWVAQITYKVKQTLGRFSTEIEAALAYDNAAVKLFGRFVNTNFKDDNNAPLRGGMSKVPQGGGGVPPNVGVVQGAGMQGMQR